MRNGAFKRLSGRMAVGLAVAAIALALAPVAAFADETHVASSLQVQSGSITTQASASSSCALLRKDGNLWRCTSAGKPVSKYWNENAGFTAQLNKVKTVFIASDVTAIGANHYAWSRYTYSDGRTSDYRNTLSFYNSKLKNVKTVKFLTYSGVNKCKTIGDNAFSYASNIKSFANFNKTKVTRIGEYAFSRSGVTSLSFPKTLKTIAKYAFNNCTGLTTVSGLNKTKLSSLGKDAFYYCQKLKSVALPSACKVVSDYAFGYCTSLKSAALGSKTSKIGYAAFYNCEKLAAISLPATCKKLDSSAFSGCSSLKKVTMCSTTVVTHAMKSTYTMSQFYGTPIAVAGSSAYIYVPKSVLSKYRSSSYSNVWYNYRTKFKAI